jgi:hypothetical protein
MTKAPIPRAQPKIGSAFKSDELDGKLLLAALIGGKTRRFYSQIAR